MKNTTYNEPISGVLTERMDFGTPGYEEFKQFIKKKAAERTPEQILALNLLAKQYEQEDAQHANDTNAL